MVAESGGDWSIDVAGAQPGQQYEFLVTNGATTVHRADPRSKQVVDDNGTFKNSIIVDPGAYTFTTTKYTTPSFAHQVIYELHLGTFVDATAPGTGTWATAMTKLDYLASLGVNMIEVLPVHEFQGSYSWGYDPSFPFAPESSYGTPEDAKRFVDAAHGRGIGVILDVVHNHYGPDLGRSLWQFDIATFDAGGIYFYTDWRENTPFGSRPDFGRPAVRDYVADNASMWLNEFQLDGLRWDSTINIRQACGDSGCAAIPDGWGLLQRVNDAVDGSQPWKIMIAEDLQGDTSITAPTSGGGAGFDSQWDMQIFSSVKAAILASQDSDRDVGSVASAIGNVQNGSATSRVVFTENHDQVAPQNGGQRLAAAVCPGLTGSCVTLAEKMTTLAGAVMLMSPGIPMLFQGQEFVDPTPFPFAQAEGIGTGRTRRRIRAS